MKKTIALLLTLSLLLATASVAMAGASDDEPIIVQEESEASAESFGDDLDLGLGFGFGEGSFADEGDAPIYEDGSVEADAEDDASACEEDAVALGSEGSEGVGAGANDGDVPPAAPEEETGLELAELLSDLDEAEMPTAIEPVSEEIDAGIETVLLDPAPDSDALFAGYVNRFFYAGSARSLKLKATVNAGSQLTGIDRALYDTFKAEILKVAAGERASTKFEAPASELLGKDRVTAEGLGLVLDPPTGSTIPDEAKAALGTAYSDLLPYSSDLITSALWLDCTYELYWLDRYVNSVTAAKSSVYGYDPDVGYYINLERSKVIFSFSVLEAYRTDDSDFYTVDASLIQRAKTAAANAKAIVSKYAGDSDCAKLLGYAWEICNLVEYNSAAANEELPEAVQDPWKLIWVFDGDDSTNVVCEGYAQAFQYLCELSSFSDSVSCYMVAGYAGEPHAWNIVRINGKSYVVDVTWMDDDSGLNGLTGSMVDWITEEKAGLFLCGASSGSVTDGYAVDWRDGRSTSFRTYRESDTLALYPASVLTLADSKYVITGWQTIDGQDYFFEGDDSLHTSHSPVVDPAVEPTCAQAGKTEGSHCSVCGEVIVAQQAIEKLPHTPATDPAVEATCTEEGRTEGTHCSVCGEVITAQAVTPAKGHDEVSDDNATEPTCTQSGKTASSRCSVCGVVIKTQTDIPAKGHNEVSDGNALEPTCTQTGLTASSHCSVCGEIIVAQKVVPAKGHTPVTDKAVAATCTASGLTEGSHCSVCGEIITAQKVVPAKGHTPVTDKAVAATCTASGLTEGSHCSVCGTVIIAQKVVPAKGHTPVTDKAVAATCTASGLTKGSHCSVCGTVITAQKVIPARGHTVVTDKAVPSTYLKKGKTAGSHCSVCGEVIVARKAVPVLDCAFHMKKNAKKTMVVGDPLQIVLDGKAIKSCKSANKKIATVTKSGRVTARKAGKVKITITPKKGKKLTLTLKVTDPPVKGVTLAQGKKYILLKGRKLALDAILNSLNAKTTLTWKTSAPKVATVSKSGVVTAKARGTAKITVTTANKKACTVVITVR